MSEPKPDELQKKPCVSITSVRTLSPEQLRKWLGDHRNRLQETRRSLQVASAQIEKQIATCDQLLADLTI